WRRDESEIVGAAEIGIVASDIRKTPVFLFDGIISTKREAKDVPFVRSNSGHAYRQEFITPTATRLIIWKLAVAAGGAFVRRASSGVTFCIFASKTDRQAKKVTPILRFHFLDNSCGIECRAIVSSILPRLKNDASNWHVSS
ncbi:MAG: hypothetical protein Q7T55_25110, partial [Solirubrobacteraceae bacterium]|nr:hypothetical protein [Solirubrobacteraceae bacterium]